jgi:hypothetical protein
LLNGLPQAISSGVAKASLLGVTLDLPEGWRGVQAVFIGPHEEVKPSGMLTMAPQAGFRDNLAFHVGPTTMKPEEYLQTLMKTMEMKGVKAEPHGVAGEAARAEVINEAPGGARVRQILHAFRPNDQETWVLTYSFLEGQGNLKEKKKFFEDLLASMKLG